MSQFVLIAMLALAGSGWDCTATDIEPQTVTAICIKDKLIGLFLFDQSTGRIIKMQGVSG